MLTNSEIGTRCS